MKKEFVHLCEILKSIIFIGFSIQIVLGTVWMCFNYAHFREFGETAGVLSGALHGIACRFYLLVYALQLICGFATGYFAVGKFCPRLRRNLKIMISLSLLTMPMALQCHLSISAYSLCASAFLLELSCLYALMKRSDNCWFMNLAEAGGCFLVTSLFLPGFFAAGIFGFLCLFVIKLPRFRKEVRKGIYSLLVIGAFAGMIWGSYSLDEDSVLIPDRESCTFRLCSRMVFPRMYQMHEFWPEEVNGLFGIELYDISCYADDFETRFRPVLLEHYDKDTVTGYYKEMMRISWNMNKKQILRQTAGDYLAYVATEAVLPLQLKGRALVSYAGRNYEQLTEHTPLLTKFYVMYSCMLFVISGLAGFVLAVIFWIKGSGKWLPAALVCIATASVLCLIYTLKGAGVMDYKYSVAVNQLWVLWILAATARLTVVGGQKEETSVE